MARRGYKKVGEDLRNSDLAAALEYLCGKGWCEEGSPVTAEGFMQNQLAVNRALLDRLVERMLSAEDAQSELDYSNLRQWVRNHRRRCFREVSGIQSLSCDLTEQAYGNLLKLVKRTRGTQRQVIENLLLEGDTTLRREIKLLGDQQREQSRKLRAREERIKKKEERLGLREQQFDDFMKNAQPILELLRDFGKEKDSGLIGSFKPILEALREIGGKDGADITVIDTTGGKPARAFSDPVQQLNHNLLVLMSAVKE